MANGELRRGEAKPATCVGSLALGCTPAVFTRRRRSCSRHVMSFPPDVGETIDTKAHRHLWGPDERLVGGYQYQ